MALILFIETATEICSAAICRDKKILAEITETGFVHSEKLIVFISELFEKTGITLNQIDAVAVSSGPGSYTGLRIGASAAKGFCFAADKPLIAVPTLLSMAAGALALVVPDPDGLLIPMIDARRMEVYTASYDISLNEIEPVHSEIITDKFRNGIRENKPLFIFGDGAAKCKPFLQKIEKASFIDDYRIKASHMAEIAEEKFSRKDFENVSLFEPFYLKEFVAGKKT